MPDPLTCLKRLDERGYLERILSLESGRPGYQQALKLVTECRRAIAPERCARCHKPKSAPVAAE